MEFVICLTAFSASLLTLFSGFGLGTLLMPVIALFFPLPVAIALCGVVHLLNNLFKLALVGRDASRALVGRFGFPSVIGGLLGAALLAWLEYLPVLYHWYWGGRLREVTTLKVILALVMIFFALMELVPSLKNLRFHPRYLSLGGLLSGFFGGLSGHQGALRSAFLLRAGLDKTAFIATGVVIACLVDLTRLPLYFVQMQDKTALQQAPLLLLTTLSAFAGAYLGARYLKKVTMAWVQYLTAGLLLLIAVLILLGL
jgi:uncharacterized protein